MERHSGICRLALACVIATRCCTLGLALAVSSLGVTAQDRAPLPLSKLSLRLTGIIADSSQPALNACVIRCSAPGEGGGLVQAGDRACGLAEIRDVLADAVVIENLATRRLELLTFSAAASRSPEPVPGPAQPSPEPTAPEVAIDLSRSTIEGYLANLPDLLTSALARPRYRDVGSQRIVDGFELSEVRPGGAAAQLGLKDGDVITEVNGEALDGLPTVMRLFGQAQSTSKVTATVIRDGRRLSLLVNVGTEPRP